MNLQPITDALAALQQVVNSSPGAVKADIWSACMTAEVRLRLALNASGLMVEVEAPQKEAA